MPNKSPGEIEYPLDSSKADRDTLESRFALENISKIYIIIISNNHIDMKRTGRK